MGSHYPDQVGGHKPCVPVVVVMCTVPPRDVLATIVVVVYLVDTGPPGSILVGSGSEWPGECHCSRSVFLEFML